MPNNIIAKFKLKFDRPLTEEDLEHISINAFAVLFKHKKQPVAVKAHCIGQPAIAIDKKEPRYLDIAYTSYLLCDELHDENLYKIKKLRLLDVTNYTDKVIEKVVAFKLSCSPKRIKTNYLEKRIQSNEIVSVFEKQTKRFAITTIIAHEHMYTTTTVEYTARESVYKKTRIM